MNTENLVLTAYSLDQIAAAVVTELEKRSKGAAKKDEVKYIETDKVCELLSITPQSLVKYRKTGAVPAYRITGTRKYKYIESEILALVNNGGVKYKRA